MPEAAVPAQVSGTVSGAKCSVPPRVIVIVPKSVAAVAASGRFGGRRLSGGNGDDVL